MSKYNKVMENIEVTEDMKSRILQEVELRDKRKKWEKAEKRSKVIKITTGIVSAAAVLTLCINAGSILKNVGGDFTSGAKGSSMPPEYEKSCSLSATNGASDEDSIDGVTEDNSSDKQSESMMIDEREVFYGAIAPEDAEQDLEYLASGKEIVECGGIIACGDEEKEISLKLIKDGSLYYRAYIFYKDNAYCVWIDAGTDDTEIFFKVAERLIK